MEKKTVDLSALAAVEGGDLCARSGLHQGPEVFATIYTYPDRFDQLFEFYEKVLGAVNVRFRGDGIASYTLFGAELILQQVREDSPFGELVGKQNVGLAVENLAQAQQHITTAGAQKSGDLRSAAEWDVPVTSMRDPDGNVIMLAEARGVAATHPPLEVAGE